MSAVEFVAADGKCALAHQRGLPVELSSLQQCEQSEGLDAGAGMRQATCGYVKTVSRENLPRLDIDNHGGAATARHSASTCFLQRRTAGLARYSWKCRDAHNHRCEA